MTTEKYPRGWDQSKVQRVLDYYEAQTDTEAAAEIEASLERTTMEVPRALVPAVRQLIAKRKGAHRKKKHKLRLQPTTHPDTNPRSKGAPRLAAERRRIYRDQQSREWK